MRNLIVIIPTITANTGGCDGFGMLAIMLSLIVLGLLAIIAGNIYYAVKAKGDKYLFRSYKKDNSLILAGRILVIYPLLVSLVVFIAAFIYSLIS